MKKIGILGSTGSVGKQTLEVIRAHPKNFKIEYLAANENVNLLIKQTNEFNPTSVCIFNKKKYETLKKNINAKNILTGSIGLTKVSTIKDIERLPYSSLSPIVGMFLNGVFTIAGVPEISGTLALTVKNSTLGN